jgi:subtilase family serine protease
MAHLVSSATRAIRRPLDPSALLTVNVWLKLHNQQQLDKLVEQQKQKNSSNYHQWITQGQFNSNYGPTPQEVNAVSNFLSPKGLTVVSVAENNLYVKAQGSVGAIQKAFNVQIHSYNKNGSNYHSNNADPSVDDAAGGLIAAITGLDDFGFEPNVAHAGMAEGASSPAFPSKASVSVRWRRTLL